MSSNGQPITPDDLSEAQAVADRFLKAVDANDLRAVWELFSDNAQAYVLNRAVDRGMDFDLMSAIRQGSASDEDFDSYLEALVEGLRRDLRGVDFARMVLEARPEPEVAGQVRVVYLQEMEMAIGDQRPSIPAGSVIMASEDGAWKVERLVPRPG